jgi:hypothetical protein
MVDLEEGMGGEGGFTGRTFGSERERRVQREKVG